MKKPDTHGLLAPRALARKFQLEVTGNRHMLAPDMRKRAKRGQVIITAGRVLTHPKGDLSANAYLNAFRTALSLEYMRRRAGGGVP